MQAAQRSAKRQKPSTSSESTEGTGGGGGGGVYSFHPEDEVIQKVSQDFSATSLPPILSFSHSYPPTPLTTPTQPHPQNPVNKMPLGSKRPGG